MFGPPLALFSRSMRTDQRLARMHVFRLLFAVIIFFSMMVAHAMTATIGAPGLYFFTPITWVNFGFISLAGVSYFATAISEEKDEATIGLLRMAGISPVAIMLGKSTSRLITALMVLVVQIPFTLLAVTLGGVTPSQIFATYAALAAWMILVANFGLFCSVVATTSARAAGLATIVLGIYLFLLPVLVSTLLAAPSWGGPAWAVSFGNALNESYVPTRIDVILTTGFGEPVWDYLFSFQSRVDLIVAAAFFAVSWMGFEFFTTDRPVRGGLTGVLIGGGPPMRFVRPGRVWTQPLAWKDFHFLTGGISWIFVKSILYLAAAGLWAWFEAMDRGRPGFWSAVNLVGRPLMVVAIVGAVVEMSLCASRIFREEAHGRTLSGLLMLPRSLQEIAWTKVAGCLLSLAPALGVLLIGALFDPDAFADVISALGTLATWYYIGMFISFLHLTAHLSLVVRWGALPLALGIVVIIMPCLFFPVFLIPAAFDNAGSLVAAIPLVGTNVGICVLFQHLIGQRLRSASEQ